MKNMYQNEDDRKKIVDCLTYEYYDLGISEETGKLSFGTSIVYP